jgi:hypothetical protein
MTTGLIAVLIAPYRPLSHPPSVKNSLLIAPYRTPPYRDKYRDKFWAKIRVFLNKYIYIPYHTYPPPRTRENTRLRARTHARGGGRRKSGATSPTTPPNPRKPRPMETLAAVLAALVVAILAETAAAKVGAKLDADEAVKIERQIWEERAARNGGGE